MKAIIPVAGIGAKLRPHTHTQPKTLVPIAGKPILSHIVDFLIEGGIQDFIFVLGYLGDKIESYISARYPEIRTEFVNQEPREGSAHAIWCCRELLKNEKEVFIMLGDTIASFDLQAVLKAEYSTLGVKKVSNPLHFGIAEIGEDGFIKKLVEKPRIPKSNLALVGIYKINQVAGLLEAIDFLMKNHIKTNNEYHLTDALMRMIYQGDKMKKIQVDNWFDCGKKETLLMANAILLNTQRFKKQTALHQYPESIIIPPVSIGDNCRIEKSIIGPNVAVGDHTIMTRAIVQDTIIGSYSELNDVVLKNSIIGNDTSLKGLVQSLNVGDSTEINFNK
ncbi:MAG: NTP transferase domain-containing protein [Microscillaceae bacterium]|nr:NTP transferase domain-containing protein [Microscillaceae bacterium]